AAAFGDMHLTPAVAWHPLITERGGVPTVTVAGAVEFLTDFRTSARALPRLSGAAGWAPGKKRHLLDAGGDLAVSFEGRGWVPIVGPFIGGELRVGRRLGLVLEGKWLAPSYETRILAPEWVSPGGYGYFSVLLGVNVYFGGVR